MLEKETFLQLENNNLINYNKLLNKLPSLLKDLPNILLFGPPCSCKYIQALKIIKYYSPSSLKYEKKLYIESLKTNHIIKISDIHYEIIMDNLTCNSKQLFHDIYNNILDAIRISNNKIGIILLRNFHNIDNELLEVFYSYMQQNIDDTIIVKFIIITKDISFIPNNIIDKSNVYNMNKLKSNSYIKISNKNNKQLLKSSLNNDNIDIYDNISNVNTIKYLELNTENLNILDLNNSICNFITNIIIENKVDFNLIRNSVYNILIYNLNIYDCVYKILENIILLKNDLSNQFIDNIYIKTCDFLKNYNNNYRPIYHLESYILYLITIINK
tara:strand:- start:2862 stop:3848 length:987 start_codon:yes stop_codon:yes gene_type:complete